MIGGAPVAPLADAGAARDARPLAGRVVLVTGAGGGLGREASIACARAGGTVVLLGRRVPVLNRVYDAIAALEPGAGEAVNYPLDLAGATPGDLAQLAARIERQLGRLDGVLHCAADFTALTPLAQADPLAFARTLHVNLTARAWLTRACLPLLARATKARVVFVVDDAPESVAYRGGYGVAQSAQVALVEMLAAELASSPVAVSLFRPGPMRTPLRARAYVEGARGRVRNPADHAAACVTLLAGGGAVAGSTPA